MEGPLEANLARVLLRSPQLLPLSILRRCKAGPCGYKCPVSGCRHTRLPIRSTGSQPASASWRSWLSTSTGTDRGSSLRSAGPPSSLGVRLPLLMTLIIHTELLPIERGSAPVRSDPRAARLPSRSYAGGYGPVEPVPIGLGLGGFPRIGISGSSVSENTLLLGSSVNKDQ